MTARDQEGELLRAVGRIEGILESIETFITESRAKDDSQDSRLGKLENRVFFIWVVGPFLIGALGFLEQIKTIFGFKGG